MKAKIAVVAAVLSAWLCTGFYVVGSNEKAVVRRCGRMVRTPEGSARLVAGGLHYDLPWPFAAVDRVNLNEVRTLSVGDADQAAILSGGFLRESDTAYRSQFLSGDKNILNVQINVHYRVSERGAAEFLYASESPVARLQRLAESALSDVVLRSGVDFVHTLGRNALRELLLRELRGIAETQRLGIDIEDVTIANVAPPVRVKAYFLDVMNARAEKETHINNARAYSEQQLADAGAEARKLLDQADSYRLAALQNAAADAESFERLIDQFEAESRTGSQTYAAARQMALRRAYLESMEQILRRVASKVLLDSGETVDLTIFGDPSR